MCKRTNRRGGPEGDEFNHSVLIYLLAVYTTIYLAAATIYLSRGLWAGN